jgi:hypothetical protein
VVLTHAPVPRDLPEQLVDRWLQSNAGAIGRCLGEIEELAFAARTSVAYLSFLRMGGRSYFAG